MIQPALLGGLFIGVLSTLPVISLANCCCLWIVGGGVLAAYLLQLNQPVKITAGEGALVGMLAGVIGAVIWLMGAVVLDSLFGPLMDRAIDSAIRSSADLPPEIRDAFEAMGDRRNPFRYVAGFAFQFFAGLIFSTLGGLLFTVFSRRDVPPALGGVQPPPVPPQQ